MKTRIIAVCVVTGAAWSIGFAGRHSAAPPSHEAIVETALDYIEGWYDGDAARMQRALHPELAKRVQWVDADSAALKIDSMGATTLVDRTRARSNRADSDAPHQKEVTVLDVFGNAASVKVVADDWVDYLHLTRLDGKWQIINVLWELKPEAKRRNGFPAQRAGP